MVSTRDVACREDVRIRRTTAFVHDNTVIHLQPRGSRDLRFGDDANASDYEIGVNPPAVIKQHIVVPSADHLRTDAHVDPSSSMVLKHNGTYRVASDPRKKARRLLDNRDDATARV